MSSTIHRFTPPTCTLEIISKKSLFSPGKSSDIATKIQFKLRFDDPRQTTFKQVTIKGNQQDLAQLQTAISNYVQQQLQSSFQAHHSQPTSQPTATIENVPSLSPQGLMHHQLFFGSLNHDSDQPSIKLGTVQLFDLITALEASQTKILAWSNQQPPKPWQKVILLGGGVAAVAIAVLYFSQGFKLQMQPEIAKKTENSSVSQSPTKIPELGEIIPPATPNLDQPTATPKLKDSQIASTKRLPPPPAVETPKPKPNIPDPADYPLSNVARQSGLNNAVQNSVVSNQEKEPGKKSVTISPQPIHQEKVIAEKIPEEIPLFSAPNSREKTPYRTQKIADGESNNMEPNIKPKFDTFDDSSVKPTQKLNADTSSRQLSSVQQATAYFKHKWQPPRNLHQSLEYRLIVETNGSIKRVVPLGKAAQIYLSQTNIPLNGEPFISPLEQSQSLIIRLLLNPNGKVQVFAESE